MENNTFAGGNTGKAIALAALMLSIFLLFQSVKTIKSISYVGKDVPAMNTISVNGEGEAFQAPDIATFTFSVEDESLIVRESQDRVDFRVKDILALLKKNGVADKDIKTLSYSVYPRYEYPQVQCFTYPCPTGERTLAGYTVTQTVSVKVRKLSDAGTLVSGIGEMGATNISGLAFMVDDEEGVKREARQLAITDAQEKAKELARDLGVSLGRIISYSEGGGDYPMYYAKDLAMGMGGDGLESAPRAAELPVGENQFISNVYITYEIK